jgi:biopolymer transport protein ExbD
MHFRRRKTPEINSTSSADIAFLLLVFFLVTSSFDARTGVYRKMAPADPEDAVKERLDIQQKNLLVIAIDADDRIRYEGEALDARQLRDLGKWFVAESDIAQHVIALKVHREARYQTYLTAMSELTAAYDELREAAAESDYHRPFLRLSAAEKDSIRAAFPVHIAESEPAEVEGGAL